MSKPLPIDERRVGRAAQACDDHEAMCRKGVHNCPDHKRLYDELRDACNTAGRNAHP